MDGPKSSIVDRAVRRVILAFGLVLILYTTAYVFFKFQCGPRFDRDPWIGPDSSMSMSGTASWGTIDPASGEMIEEFRTLAFSFGSSWDRKLDSLFFPAKQIDQKISGWQVSFSDR